MISPYLSVTWAAIARALGNHLWQSMLFAGTAGLLTLLLRRNYARARYWLWLAASVKFLIPFSLLVGIGSHLGWSLGSTGTRTGLYFAMEEVGQPFTQPTMSLVSRATFSTASLSLIHLAGGSPSTSHSTSIEGRDGIFGCRTLCVSLFCKGCGF
jgi:bla regulator protein blaR1